jgi:metallo-beta-lactamase class B
LKTITAARAAAALLAAVCVGLLARTDNALAQQPTAGAPPPLADTPAAAAHRAAAARAAGSQWKSEYGFYCEPGEQHRMKFPDEPIEPQWIFDDVAVIGDRSTAVFVLKTSAGVMLIDSGYSDKVEALLLPSLAKLSIDPASVRTIVITHGHPDHYGGAPYFQEHFGTRIVASAADWPLITSEHTAPPQERPQAWMVAKGPTRDLVIGDGEEIVLGDMHVRAFLIPGHTPGSLGLIFPVKDAGRTRMAAIFGGTILSESHSDNEVLNQYVQSLAHFSEATRKAKADVELQNHPVFDDMWMKAKTLSERRAGAPNPFVVGTREYQNFLSVMSQCTQALMAQRR